MDPTADLTVQWIITAFLAGILGGLIPFCAMWWGTPFQAPVPSEPEENLWLDEEAEVFFGLKD